MAWQLGMIARTASEAVPSSQLPYNGAGPWVEPCVTLETIPAHMLQLIALMRRAHPWIRSVSPIRNCERRADGSLSMHATGRAADIMVPVHSGPEGLALANWLVENAKNLGAQLVIWDHQVWQGSLPVARRFAPYTGRSPHVDHVHVELTTEPGPWLAPPTAPIAPQLMSFIRAVIAPGLVRARPSRASTAPAWMAAGAIVGAGAAAARALASGRPGAPAPLVPAAIAGALVGLILSPTTSPASTSPARSRRVMRY